MITNSTAASLMSTMSPLKPADSEIPFTSTAVTMATISTAGKLMKPWPTTSCPSIVLLITLTTNSPFSWSKVYGGPDRKAGRSRWTLWRIFWK